MAKSSQSRKKVRRAQKTKKTTKKLGPASNLAGKLWPAWRRHLLLASTTWMHVLAVLCHMFCLRVSEGLALRASDFKWKAGSLRVKPMKRAGEAWGMNVMPSRMHILRLTLSGVQANAEGLPASIARLARSRQVQNSSPPLWSLRHTQDKG